MTHCAILGVSQVVFERSMRLYLNRIAVKKIFDKIQSELHCCESRRYDDWFDVRYLCNLYQLLILMF